MVIRIIYSGKTFCTLGFSGTFCLNQNWLHLVLFIVFKETILQRFNEFQTETQGFLTTLSASKASRGHLSKGLKCTVTYYGSM